ncbi:MAG: hypothetical protein KAT28_05570 [Candidatus Aenigmarchaeota archaeon]|nr:hypothetical protein [Candidatus Aenigmarchaeota archaeon]
MESSETGNLLLFIGLIIFVVGFIIYLSDYLGVINLDFSGIPIFGELQESIFGK